jgi:ribosomal protein S17
VESHAHNRLQCQELADVIQTAESRPRSAVTRQRKIEAHGEAAHRGD